MVRLDRERRGPSLGERWQRIWPPVLVGFCMATAIALVAIGIDHALVGAPAEADPGGATSKVACLRAYQDRGRLYVVGGLPMYGAPPARLVLESCGFWPGETAQVDGRLSGWDVCGRPFQEPLGPITATADDDGVLRVMLAIPNPDRAKGLYRLYVVATGKEGTSAYLDEEPEGQGSLL